MRVGEPIYAIKFIIKVRVEQLREVISVLSDSALPALSSSGFREVFVLSRGLELEKVDPQAPGVAGSPVLRKLVRNARPHEISSKQLVEKLIARPGGHKPGGFGHGMMLHQQKKGDPASYARLRESRIEEDRQLSQILLARENLLRVPGYQLECHALYRSEADFKDDTLDLEARRREVPFSGEFLGGKLEGLLFTGLSGIFHTVIQHTPPESTLRDISPETTGRPLFASQVRFTVSTSRLRQADSRLRDSLLPGLVSSAKATRALVLRSRREGFSGESWWRPATLSEHRGGPAGTWLREISHHQPDPPVPHEVLAFWQTEAGMLAGSRWLEESVAEVFAGVALARKEAVEVHLASSELALHA